MRVSVLTSDFLPSIGGVTQHIVEISKAMIAMGVPLEVIAPYPSTRWSDLWKPPFKEEPAGIPTFRIPYVLNRSVKFLSGQISSRFSSRRFTETVLRRLRETRPDLVHWHALELTRIPLLDWNESARVWTNHTSHFIVGLTTRRRELYRIEAEQADEIIAPSEELRDLTITLGVEPGRVHFIPNGVDCGRFTPNSDTSKWRARLRLAEGERLVLCPRRLEKKNGASYFIEAALSLLDQGLEQVRFAVAGNFSGPAADSDEKIVADLIGRSRHAGRFELLGRVENPDMPGLYACSDLVVMPSLMEATSLSAMEAMAAAKAIVSTDVGGLPFLIRHDENGLLVAPRDPVRMAAAIKVLLDDREQAARFGAAGRRRVEQDLDWTAIADTTRGIYEKALARFRSNGGQ